MLNPPKGPSPLRKGEPMKQPADDQPNLIRGPQKLIDTRQIRPGTIRMEHLSSVVRAELGTRKQAAGVQSVFVANGANVTRAVTFPAGRFSEAPAVTLGVAPGTANGSGWSVAVHGTSGGTAVSATGFTLNIRNDTNADRTFIVYWHAVEMD